MREIAVLHDPLDQGSAVVRLAQHHCSWCCTPRQIAVECQPYLLDGKGLKRTVLPSVVCGEAPFVAPPVWRLPICACVTCNDDLCHLRQCASEHLDCGGQMRARAAPIRPRRGRHFVEPIQHYERIAMQQRLA